MSASVSSLDWVLRKLTSSILGTRSTLTLLRHGDKVQCSIQPTRQLTEINIERELIPDQVEHLIVVRVLHEIRARPNIRRVLALRDKLERKGVARSRNTISAAVVRAFDGAVLRASSVGGTSCLVPFIAIEAVCVAASGVDPAPIGVDDDFAVDVRAATTTGAGAALPGHLGVSFGLLGANDPSRDIGGAESQHDCGCGSGKHCFCTQ